MTIFLLLSDHFGFVDMGRPLWREHGSVFYNCCCLRQRSNSQVRAPRGSWPPFTVSDLKPPNLEDQVPVFISPRNRVARLYPQALGWTSTKLNSCVQLGGPKYLFYNPFARTKYKTSFLTKTLLLREYSLPRESAYRYDAEMVCITLLFIRLSRSHCIATAVRGSISFITNPAYPIPALLARGNFWKLSHTASIFSKFVHPCWRYRF
jgi:hypothetical protein